ncbi:PKD domain-containing protein [Halovivax gelatinilyticus]|uniref:PKD domain-containing protein n=1 Tax=Halovivax gelatinilyticus TaxID=2961597 RepID=UPI0020CA5025|nr:PKD domain-containing protein [Halovivax gelatinilyticus]
MTSQEPISYVDVPGGAVNAVPGVDGVVYVAILEGMATVDVSDPDNPELLATVTDTGLNNVWDVKQHDDRAIVVGPANTTGSVNGVGLYDVSDPADPVLLDFEDTNYAIHNSYLTEDIAYIVNNSTAEAVFFDVSDDSITEINRWGLSNASLLHDHYAHDDVLYMCYWDDGTVMLDVSDPMNPSMIGKIRDGSTISPNNDHYVVVNEDSSICCIGKEAMGSWNNLGVELWDISDETDTQFLAEIEPPDEPTGEERTSHNLDIYGDYVYTSWYDGGVRVHDISDPTAPEEVFWWRGNGTSFWTAELTTPGTAFIGSDAQPAGGNSRIYTFPDPGDHGEGPPVARLSIDPSSPSVGESVTFDGSDSSAPGGSITAYDWSVDGQSVGSGETITHVFDSADTYTVELTVTDDSGATDSAAESVTVDEDDGECGDEIETTIEDGFLAWWNMDDVHSYATQTSDPCAVTIELAGPNVATYDLYVTYDGRTPTPGDYDDRSTGDGSNETISAPLEGSTDVGILVDGVDGWGEYTVAITEEGM